jgi:hypothetical protein
MNFFKHLVLLFFILPILSCSKNDNELLIQDSQKLQLSKAASQVLEMRTIGEIKKSFSLLESKDKEAIWKLKLSSIINDNNSILTAKQREIVINLYDFLEKNSYEKLIKNPAIGQEYLKNNYQNFSNNFTKEQMYLLIEFPYYTNQFSLDKATQYLTYLQDNDVKIKSLTQDEEMSSGTPNCACYYSISCFGLANNCEEGKNGCSKISECGLFGTSNCTGMCSY